MGTPILELKINIQKIQLNSFHLSYTCFKLLPPPQQEPAMDPLIDILAQASKTVAL